MKRLNKEDRVVIGMGCRWNILMLITITSVELLGWALSAQAAEKRTILAMEYPPYESSTLPSDGLAGEILDNIFAQMGIEDTFEYQPLKRAINNIVTGENHLFVGNLSFFTEQERENLILLPFVNIRMVFFYDTTRYVNAIDFETLEQLKDYRIGILLGGFEKDILMSHQLTVYENPNYEGLFRMLNADRIDLCASLDISGLDMIRRIFPGDEQKFGIVAKPLASIPAGLIMSKNLPGYQSFMVKFQQSFATIKANGTYLSILEKYYGKGNVPKDAMVE